MLILPHLKGLTAGNIGSAAFKNASLDLKFADNKSLIDAITGSNLVTFTRASSGTFVGSDGVLQTAVTNLQTFSEEFNNAAYGASAGSVTGINAGIAPNGTSTADEITSTGGGIFRSLTVTTATVYTASVYAKYVSGGASFSFGCDSNPANGRTVFNLQTGVIISNGANVTSSSMSPAGNGWYRCAVTFTSTSTSIILVYYNATSGSKYLIWGAQLEQASTVGEYIPTTSVINSAPRFDHNPTTGESLGLLVEEQRTNLTLNSETFSAGTWDKVGVTITPDNTASPTGATTADAVLETATGADHIIYAASLATFTTATHSIYVKPNGRTNVALRFYYGANDWVVRVFSLTGSGSVTQSSAGSSSGFSVVSSAIVDAGNGWYRLSMTATQSSRATIAAVLDLCSSSTPTLDLPSGSEFYSGDVTKGIYVWGSQLEAGAFPTSYIPTTTTATATRAADVANITGSNFSSFYNQTEGTVYHQGRTLTAANFFSIDDGTVNNRLTSYMTSATAPFFFVQTGGAAIANLTSSAIIAGSLFAQANNYKAADFAIVTNGGTITTSSVGAVPVVNKMVIGANVNGGAPVNGTIKRLTYFPTRLANATLQAITQ